MAVYLVWRCCQPCRVLLRGLTPIRGHSARVRAHDTTHRHMRGPMIHVQPEGSDIVKFTASYGASIGTSTRSRLAGGGSSRRRFHFTYRFNRRRRQAGAILASSGSPPRRAGGLCRDPTLTHYTRQSLSDDTMPARTLAMINDLSCSRTSILPRAFDRIGMEAGRHPYLYICASSCVMNYEQESAR